MLSSNKASVTPPALRPCATRLARKVSQGWGPQGCISVQWRELGQRWPEPLSGSTCSWPLLPFRLSTPGKWLTPGQNLLPLCLCSHQTLSLEGVSPANSTCPGPLLAAAQEASYILLLEQFKELMLSNWCWRRLLRVPQTARRSNQSILKEINTEYSLEGLMLKLKLRYFGHLR